jgi:hypothetical protein
MHIEIGQLNLYQHGTVGNVTASGVEDVLVNEADGASATCWIPVLVDNIDGTPVDDGVLAHDAGGAGACICYLSAGE